jgi:hypothetical protein
MLALSGSMATAVNVPPEGPTAFTAGGGGALETSGRYSVLPPPCAAAPAMGSSNSIRINTGNTHRAVFFCIDVTSPLIISAIIVQISGRRFHLSIL